MLKCEQRARISSRLSPNAITAGRGARFCSLRRASLFAFGEEEVGKAAGRAGVCGPLTPWKLPGSFALAQLILWPLQHIPETIPHGDEGVRLW